MNENPSENNQNDWNKRLFDDKELDQIRWLFSLLGNYCGSKRAKSKSLCFARRGFKTDHEGFGRCKFHGGMSSGYATIEGKRSMILSKLRKLDPKSKLQIDIFNEKELEYYEQIRDFIKENYEVDDPLLINQISKLIVYQNFLMQRLHDGYNVDITLSSNAIRSWLSEYKLTPKSRDAQGYKDLPTGFLATVIENLYKSMEDEQKEKEEMKQGGE